MIYNYKYIFYAKTLLNTYIYLNILIYFFWRYKIINFYIYIKKGSINMPFYLLVIYFFGILFKQYKKI